MSRKKKNATIKTEDPEKFYTLQDKLGEGWVLLPLVMWLFCADQCDSALALSACASSLSSSAGSPSTPHAALSLRYPSPGCDWCSLCYFCALFLLPWRLPYLRPLRAFLHPHSLLPCHRTLCLVRNRCLSTKSLWPLLFSASLSSSAASYPGGEPTPPPPLSSHLFTLLI